MVALCVFIKSYKSFCNAFKYNYTAYFLIMFRYYIMVGLRHSRRVHPKNCICKMCKKKKKYASNEESKIIKIMGGLIMLFIVLVCCL